MTRLVLVILGVFCLLGGEVPARYRRDARAVQASEWLQKVRETADFTYLDRASSLVDRILTDDPRNYEGLRLRLEIAMHHHRFPKVIEYAQELEERNPSDSGVIGLMGDAFLEMGRYEEAEHAFRRMADLKPGLLSYNRIAWILFVTGKPEEALQWMAAAVASGSPVAENAAWCLVEYGDLLFKTGHPKEAEESYRLGLERFPNYHRANGALGRLLAAQGQREPAIEYYKKAQASVPLPEYAAGLMVLFRLSKRLSEAEQQQKLVDAVDRLIASSGETANRTLAMIYADSDHRLARALELARAEFQVRNDVYSHDTLSWVLFKNGHLAEAVQASRKAMALGTAEPLFFYHAGQIAAATGDRARARELLSKALALSPNFDVTHAPKARQLLTSLAVP